MKEYWYNREKGFASLLENKEIKRIDPATNEVLKKYITIIFEEEYKAKDYLKSKGYYPYREIYGH